MLYYTSVPVKAGEEVLLQWDLDGGRQAHGDAILFSLGGLGDL
jgi:hypothetical protein